MLSLFSSCRRSFAQTCSKLWMLRFVCIRCIWRMDVLMNHSIRTRILRHVHNALSATCLLACYSAMTTQRVMIRVISSTSIGPLAGTLRSLDNCGSIRRTHTKDMIRSSRRLPPVPLHCNAERRVHQLSGDLDAGLDPLCFFSFLVFAGLSSPCIDCAAFLGLGLSADQRKGLRGSITGSCLVALCLSIAALK